MPLDYSQGKIYKIVSNITDDVYIGSTCNTINRRLTNHIQLYKSFKKGIRKNSCSSFQIIENGEYDIVLIEDFPCDRKEQLHARERYYIENIKCINKVIPGRTNKQYREDNKDIISEKTKIYREANKEKILEQQKAYHEKVNINKEKRIKLTEEEKAQRKAQRKARWFQENKERLQARNKKWAEDHPEKNKEYKNNWYEKNKESIKANYENVKDKKNERRRELYKLKQTNL